MLFKRRTQLGWWDRFKRWLWPRVSWRRSVLYYAKRILRLSGTPYAIAMGTAVGAGAALTPFIGFHFVITFAIAWLLGGNMIAGAIGTCIGNPLTYPLIWASTYQLGRLLLEGARRDAPPQLQHDLTHKSLAEIMPLLEPMTVGSIPLGIAVGCIVYFLTYRAVAAYQQARRKRLAEVHARRGVGALAEAGRER